MEAVSIGVSREAFGPDTAGAAGSLFPLSLLLNAGIADCGLSGAVVAVTAAGATLSGAGAADAAGIFSSDITFGAGWTVLSPKRVWAILW